SCRLATVRPASGSQKPYTAALRSTRTPPTRPFVPQPPPRHLTAQEPPAEARARAGTARTRPRRSGRSARPGAGSDAVLEVAPERLVRRSDRPDLFGALLQGRAEAPARRRADLLERP